MNTDSRINEITDPASLTAGTCWRVRQREGGASLIAPQPGWASWTLAKTGLHRPPPPRDLNRIASALETRLADINQLQTGEGLPASVHGRVGAFVQTAEAFVKQLPARNRWTPDQKETFGNIERDILACQLGVRNEIFKENPELFLFIKLNNLHKAILQSNGKLKLHYDSARGAGFDAVNGEGEADVLYWNELKGEVEKNQSGFVPHPGGLMGLGHMYIYGPKGLVPVPSDEAFQSAIDMGQAIDGNSGQGDAEQTARKMIELIVDGGALSTQREHPTGEWVISIKSESANRNRARGDHAWLVFETPEGQAFSLGLYRSTFSTHSQIGSVVMHDPSDLWTAGGTHEELPLAFEPQGFVEILTEVLEDHMSPTCEYNLLHNNCLDYALDKIAHGRPGLNLPLNTHLLQYAFEGQGQGSPAWSFFSSLIPFYVGGWVEPTPEVAKSLAAKEMSPSRSRAFEAERQAVRQARTVGGHVITGMYAFRKTQLAVRDWRMEQLTTFDQLVAAREKSDEPLPADWSHQAESKRRLLLYYSLPPQYAREEWRNRVFTGRQAYSRMSEVSVISTPQSQ
jgi:hypothetical protein